jgi:hypothetical protein
MKLRGKSPSWATGRQRRRIPQLGGPVKTKTNARKSRELRDREIQANFKAGLRQLAGWIAVRSLIGSFFNGGR